MTSGFFQNDVSELSKHISFKRNQQASSFSFQTKVNLFLLCLHNQIVNFKYSQTDWCRINNKRWKRRMQFWNFNDGKCPHHAIICLWFTRYRLSLCYTKDSLSLLLGFQLVKKPFRPTKLSSLFGSMYFLVLNVLSYSVTPSTQVYHTTKGGYISFAIPFGTIISWG